MKRDDIWAWYKNLKPRKPKKRKQEKNWWDVKACAVVERRKGWLIFGLFGKDGKRIGTYYIIPSGRSYIKAGEEDAWSEGTLEYLVSGHTGYFFAIFDYILQVYAEKDSGSGDGYGIISDWINEYFPEYSDGRVKLLTIIASIESDTRKERRANSVEARRERISRWAADMPDYPDNFREWAERVAFGNREYAFGDKASDRFFCTACGEYHNFPGLKNRKTAVCPKTGKILTCDKVSRYHYTEKRYTLMQPYRDLQGNPCAIERFGKLCREQKEGNTTDFWVCDEIVVILFRDRPTIGRNILYKYGDRWDDRRIMYYGNNNPTWGVSYLYPDVSALKGTIYGHLGLETAASKGWELNYNNLLYMYDHDELEYIIKGRYHRLIRDISVQGYFAFGGSPSDASGETATERAIGLDGQAAARLRERDGGMIVYRWLRAQSRKGFKVSDHALDVFDRGGIDPGEVLAMIGEYGLTLEKIANYLEKNRKDTGGYMTTLNTWRDMLDMARKLKMDMANPMVVRPKSLIDRHGELTGIMTAEADKLRAEETERAYPKIAERCGKIRPLFEYSDGVHEIIVPTGAFDIIQEGKKLCHCVGSTDRYFDRIEADESYILFLRRCKNRDTPWYTLEVEPGGCVRQLRTMGDAEGTDREEAKEFLKKWRSAVGRKMKQGDRELAVISRMKRLKEFEQMRRDGNVIRNGNLAGQLLVDVLEKDFREFNKEEEAI